jgi:hypothetical protein
MTKKWFGPVLCPSGCCYEPPPPPPPPPCACDNVECFPEDELNFSSVKFEVDLDDELTMIAQVKTLRCTDTCKNMYQVEEREYTFSGLSALNGTYDIPYYVYDDYTESYIEGDPLAIPCGVWFYPTIAATITETLTVRKYAIPADIYSVYDSSTCIDSTVSQSQYRTFYLETRSGLIWTDEYPALFGSPFYGVCGLCGFNSTWPQLNPPVLQRKQEGSVFACSTYGEPAIDEEYYVDATRPECNSPLDNLICIPYGLGNNFGESRAVGVGYDPAKTVSAEPRRSTGYPWGDYPYGGPGIPVSSTQCKLDIEEYDDQIYATSTDVNPDEAAVCPAFWWIPPPAPGTRGTIFYHFEHTAFSQVLRSIVNAP